MEKVKSFVTILAIRARKKSLKNRFETVSVSCRGKTDLEHFFIKLWWADSKA